MYILFIYVYINLRTCVQIMYYIYSKIYILYLYIYIMFVCVGMYINLYMLVNTHYDGRSLCKYSIEIHLKYIYDECIYLYLYRYIYIF